MEFRVDGSAGDEVLRAQLSASRPGRSPPAAAPEQLSGRTASPGAERTDPRSSPGSPQQLTRDRRHTGESQRGIQENIKRPLQCEHCI